MALTEHNVAAPREHGVHSVAKERLVPVVTDHDIIVARKSARAIAEQIGFLPGDATVIATVVSELARNIVDYASQGEVVMSAVDYDGRRGLVVVARDAGPGIRDVMLAMSEGYSTIGRAGRGLPGVRRLMDEFEIITKTGRGTCVTVKKWIKPAR